MNKEIILSERLKVCSIETINKIIKLGEYVYFNSQKDFENSINKNMNEIYEERIKGQKEMIEEKWQAINEHNMKQIDFLKQRINQLERESVTGIFDKLDSLLGKGNSVDNAAKGDFGENLIESQIYNYYPKSKVIDNSAETGKADRLWQYDTMNCLIEVKNVQNVRPSDVSKFERDFRNGITNGFCNSGIFISCKTENIPSKGRFSIEYIDSYPIIYVCDIFNDPKIFKIALDCIYILFKNINIEEDTNKNEKQFIEFLIPKINDLITNIKSFKNLINNEERILNDIIIKLQQLGHSLLIQDNSKESLKEKYISEFVHFYNQHKRFPNTSEISDYKPHIFRDDLAIKRLKDEANKRIKRI